MKHRKNTRKRGSIVWAIDPYESKTAHRTPLARAVAALSRGLNEAVAPFSVVSPAGTSWPIPVSYAMGRSLEAFGADAVRRDLEKFRVKNVLPPAIEVRDSTSRRDLVDEVLRYAKMKKAGFIAVNTRRLLSPFPRRIGGFAEALIGKSALPVLAVSPKAKVSARFQRILFPTDFSSASHRAFRKLLAIAAPLKAEITMLNVEQPMEMPFLPPDLASELTESYVMDAEKQRNKTHRKTAQRWTEEASRSGVKCRFLSRRGSASVPEEILKAARSTRSDLLCLTGKRSSRTPALLGGIVRDVLGEARTPVLEIHQ